MSETYTYRNGKKLPLVKEDDRFVVRALSSALAEVGLPQGEVMSSASTRVTCSSRELEPLMARARGVAPTHHSYLIADTGAAFPIADRVLVQMKAEMSPEQIAAFAGEYGLVLREQYPGNRYLFQLTNATGMNPVKLVVKLTEEDDRVVLAENDVNHRMGTQQFAVPQDPRFLEQWHLHTRRSHPDIDPRSSARCEEAWQAMSSLGDGLTTVCISDDGCLLAHGDFDAAGKFAAWGYFRGSRLIRNTDADADPAAMYQSGSNHGTSCCGVAAGEADGILTVGAAPDCRLLPIKWESSGSSLFISDSKMMTALAFIADKADVMSNSWGGVPFSIWAQFVVDEVERLTRSGGRRNKGIVFLWAAGNENCPIEHEGTVDIPYTNGWTVSPQGVPMWIGVETSKVFHNNLVGVPGVVHVAALASSARRSHYSNYGTGIDICAPTNNVHEYHRLIVEGLGIVTTTGAGGLVSESFGGTSSACPLAAGVAALVISANPNLSAADVISTLQRTASKDLDFTPYPRTPPANFDPEPTWDVSPVSPYDTAQFTDIGHPDGTWNPQVGFGKVDAAAAVAAAIAARQPSAGAIRRESSPALGIPDNALPGVSDTITIVETGAVSDLSVEVDISHSWIGDLVVSLTAPDATTVLLHDRGGGSTTDLRATFDTGNTAPLTGLLNREAHGDWTLSVTDRAPADVGRLNRWALSLARGTAPIAVEEVGSFQIPDNDPAGITRSLTVPGSPTIADLSVSVDITHSWIGDLRVVLTAPSGATVLLHDRSGGSLDNIVRTWRAADLSGLQALLGSNGSGAWQLNVADVVGQDVGKLSHWRLEITT